MNEDLGTQVYLWEDGEPRIELTDNVDPGFGTQFNKYSWTIQNFDGDDNGVDELYVGTLNAQLNYIGVLALVLRLQAIIETGGLSIDLDDLDSAFTAINEFLQQELPSTLKSNGGEIWRYDFQHDVWDQVVGVDLPGIDDGDVGFRESVEFDGKLYAAATAQWANGFGTASKNPPKIIVTEDGDNWTQLSGGPLTTETGNDSIRTMEVVTDGDGNEVLLVGTSNPFGAEIWTLDGDGNWTFLLSLPALFHSETFVFDGDIYLGTLSPYSVFRLDLSGDEPEAINVTPTNVEIDDQGVLQFAEHNGYFYVGGVNYFNGASLFRTMTPNDPSSYEVVTTDGFQTDGQGNELLDNEFDALGVDASLYVWQMASVGGKLYVGDFNAVDGLLLVSEDGLDWEIAESGFDGAYGLRKFFPINMSGGVPVDGDPNSLIIGTADNIFAQVSLDELIPPSGDIIPPNLGAGSIMGTDLEDWIFGGGFDDLIDGKAEDDFLFGDLGGPIIFSGNDTIIGGEGFDRLFGNKGDDEIWGDEGEDLLVGGFGSDTLRGGNDIDLLIGDNDLSGFGIDLISSLLPAILPTPTPEPLPKAALAAPAPSEGMNGQMGELMSLMEGLGIPVDLPVDTSLPSMSELEEMVDFPLMGEPPTEEEIIAYLQESLPEIFPGAEGVFQGLFGQGLFGTFSSLGAWWEQKRLGGTEPLSTFFPDANLPITPELELALATLAFAIDAALDELEMTLSELLDDLADLFEQLDHGGDPIEVPGCVLVLMTEMQTQMALMAEDGIDGPGGEPMAPLEMLMGGGMEAFLVAVPGFQTILPALQTVGDALDSAAQETYDQGFLDAIADFSGLYADDIYGEEGSDIAFAGKGSDNFWGGPDDDLFYGNSGFDSAWGGTGNDILFGENGNDWFDPGPGNDYVNGGLGSQDVVWFDATEKAFMLRDLDGEIELTSYSAAVDDSAMVDFDAAPFVLNLVENDIPEIDRVDESTETFDFDGNELSYSSVAALAATDPRMFTFFTLDLSGTLGDVTVNMDGTITYDPSEPGETIDPNGFLIDTFSYTQLTGDGGEETGTVSIQINGPDFVPPEPEPEPEPMDPAALVARDDIAEAMEDGEPVVIDVLDNDRLGQGGVRIVSLPKGQREFQGEVTISDDGRSVIYDPGSAFQSLNEGVTGADYFSYTIVDDAGQESTANVKVNIEGKNDAPFAFSTTVSTFANESIFFNPLTGDIDALFDPQIVAVQPTLDGILGNVLSQTFFFSPNGDFDDLEPGQSRMQTVQYMVSDEVGATEVANLNIIVRGGTAEMAVEEGSQSADQFALADLSVRAAIDGGEGDDMVEVEGTLSQFIFEPIEGGHRLHPLEPAVGSQAQDLFSIETVAFDDVTVERVSDPALENIAFFYYLTYDRAPDVAGQSYWYSAHQNGMDLGAIADSFASAPEFLDVFGAEATNRDFVEALYNKGLERGSDQEGQDHWTAQLDSGKFDRGDMLRIFADSDEMRELHENTIDDGLWVTV